MKGKWGPEMKKILKNIKKVEYEDAPPPAMGCYVGDTERKFSDNGEEEFLTVTHKLDDWFTKKLLNDPNTKYYNGESPYKNYTHIENILRRYGKEYVEKLTKECPVRQKSENRVYDSLSFVIFNNRINISSIIKIPVYRDVWDRISDEGHV